MALTLILECVCDVWCVICDLGEAEEEGEGQHQEGAELKRQNHNIFSHT